MDVVNIKQWNVIELACAVNAVKTSKLTDARNTIERLLVNLRTENEMQRDLNDKISEEDKDEGQYDGKVLNFGEDIERLNKGIDLGRIAVRGVEYQKADMKNELTQSEVENEYLRNLIEEELQRNKDIGESVPVVKELKNVAECQEKLENEIQLLLHDTCKMEDLDALFMKEGDESRELSDERMEVRTKNERDTTLWEEKYKRYKSFLGKIVVKRHSNMKIMHDIKSKHALKQGDKFTIKHIREKHLEDNNRFFGIHGTFAWYLKGTALPSTCSNESLLDRYGMKSPVKSVIENDNAPGSRSSIFNNLDLNIRQSKLHDLHDELAEAKATSSKPVKTEGTVSSLRGAMDHKSPQLQSNGKSISINNVSDLPDSLEFRNACGVLATGEFEKAITNGLDKYATPGRERKTQLIPEEKESPFIFAVPATPALIRESSQDMLDYQKLCAKNVTKNGSANNLDLNIRQSKLHDLYELTEAKASSSKPVETEGTVSSLRGAMDHKSPQLQSTGKSISINNVSDLPDSLEFRNASGVLATGEFGKVITNGLDKYATPGRQRKTQLIPEEKESPFIFAVPATPTLIRESSQDMLDYQKLCAQNVTKNGNEDSPNFPERKLPFSILSTLGLKKFSYLESEFDQNSLDKLVDTATDSSVLDCGGTIKLTVEESAKQETKHETSNNDTKFISDLGINKNVANVLTSEERAKTENKENDFLNEVSGQSDKESGTKMLRQLTSRRLKRSVSENQILTPIQVNKKVKKARKSAEMLRKVKSKFNEKSKTQKHGKLKKIQKSSSFETPKKNEDNSGLFGSNSVGGHKGDISNSYLIDDVYYSDSQLPVSNTFEIGLESGNESASYHQYYFGNRVQFPEIKPFQFDIKYMSPTKKFPPSF